MPTINLPSIGDDPTLEDVIDAFERLRKELTWLLQKNLDTKNAREFAGWQIRPDRLVSVDGDVGMSTEDTGGDDVRFFAGPSGDIYKFYVTKGGKLYAFDGTFEGEINASIITGGAIIGAEIMTNTPGNYPRTSMSTAGTLFSAEASSTNSMTIKADGFGETMLKILGSGVTAQIFPQSGKLLIQTAYNDGPIQITSGEDLELFAPSFDASKVVKVNSWARFVNALSNRSLQQDLNDLQDQIDDLDARVTALGG